MEPNTYKGWRQVGCHVIRGRKSCGRNDKGECLFAAIDVEPDDIDDDYDHPMESVLQAETEGW